MSEWKLITAKAEQAKQALIDFPGEGKKQFDALSILYPDDGMVYFKRAEALESIGKPVEASEDYQKALVQFPKPAWKAQARAGLERCQTAKPPNPAPMSNDVNTATHQVSIEELGRMRRTILVILDSVEAQTEDGVSPEKKIYRQISDLASANRLPRNVAGWMKAVTEQRTMLQSTRERQRRCPHQKAAQFVVIGKPFAIGRHARVTYRSRNATALACEPQFRGWDGLWVHFPRFPPSPRQNTATGHLPCVESPASRR